MGGWNGVYTTQGLNLLAKLSPGGTLNITRAVTGTGVVAETQLNYQTAVTGEKQELSFQTPSYPESGVCKLPVTLTNEGLTTGYTAHQIGFYAKGADNKEILYFLAQSETGTDILPETDVSGYAATWVFYFQYGQADDVTVVVDPANAVTIDMLEEVRILAMRGVSDQKFGNPLVFEESAKLPFAGLSLYGKSVQNGTPSPNAPVDIKSLSEDGNIKLGIYGKNLLSNEVETKEHQGIKFTTQTDGGMLISGTATDSAMANMLTIYEMPTQFVRNVLYTISGASEKASLQVYQNIGGEWDYVVSTTSQATFTLSDEANGILVRYVVKPGVAIYEKLYPMIRLSEIKDSTFEVFQEKTVSLSTPNGLRGIPVSSGGNYTDINGQQWICDEIDLVRGVYIQRILERQITDFSASSNYLQSNGYTEGNIYLGERILFATGLSDHFVYAANGTHERFAALGNGAIYFVLAGELTLEEWRTRMTNLAPTIMVALETPVETPLSIETPYANNSTTMIVNDSDVEMMVDCIRNVNENAFAMVLEKAGDSKQIIQQLNTKATTETYTVTIPTTGWATGTDQYTVEVAVSGMLATDNPITAPIWSTTAADRENEIDAWSCVEVIETAANKIKVYANEIPETAITIQMKVVR